MERLTCIDLRDSENMGGYCVKHPEKTKTIDLINRLAHYEDLSEQGRLVELPCKIGDTIYDIYAVVKNGCGKIIPETVITIAIAEDRKGTFFYINRIRMDYSDFGKYVFFSSEEAEQALAERQE